MKSHSPKVKLIYLMRDPIERIVSQYLHEWSRREVKGSLEEAVDRNERFLAYSCYARQLEPFLEAFGSAQVLVVFFERLVGEPDAEFSRVCRFIGDPSEEKPCWDAGLGARNVAGERLRNSSLREGLLSLAPIRALKDRIPQGARDVLKSPWRAPKRPVPSDALRARLESEIDRDLEQLAGWLGIELSCGNWAERMRSLPGDTLHWRAFS